MKFCQLLEYNARNIFLQNKHAENEAGRLVQDLFVFKNTSYEVKPSG